MRPVPTAVVSVLDHPGSDAHAVGRALVGHLLDAGHPLACWSVLCEEDPAVRAETRRWIAVPEVRAVILSGEGPAVRAAVRALRERPLEVGAGVIGGLAGATRLFAMSGGRGTVEAAWASAIGPALERVGPTLAWTGAGALP